MIEPFQTRHHYEYLNVRCSEMPNPSLIAIPAHLSLMVDHAAAPNANFNPTCTSPSQRLDAQLKGLIRCESCPETFTTRGRYKYVSLFVLDPSFGLTVSTPVAIAKPIPGHTVVTVAKGL